MGQLAIVNAPSSFAFIWSVMKPWLSKETAEKVDILGSDYKDVLLDLVDADALPSTLGGNCTCEEAGGCHMSGVGPWLEGRQGWGPNAQRNAQAAASRQQSEDSEDNSDQDSDENFEDARDGSEILTEQDTRATNHERDIDGKEEGRTD